jgi:hypothetical protein
MYGKRGFLDHRTKLSWAQAHLDALEAEVDAFLDGDPYEVRLKYDRERAAYVATVYVHKSIPLERWGLMVGDIVHGTRSALDALMYSLWTADVGRKPTDDEVTRIQFIIADDPGFWEDERKRRLRLVGPRLQAALEGVQPYRRKRPQFRSFLSVVRDLSNIDKHRHILVVGEGTADAGITFTFPNGGIFRVAGWRGRLVNKTEIAVVDFRDADGTLVPRFQHPSMDVHAHLVFDIAFEQGWPAYSGPVLPGLRGCIAHIEHNIFRWLEPYL